MADPLMLPVKDSAIIAESLKNQLNKDLKTLVADNRFTQDLVVTLMSQVADDHLKDQLHSSTNEIQQAKTFTQVDTIISRLNDVKCVGESAAACQEGKHNVLKIADNRKEIIARSEFEYGVTQTIELGLATGRLTKSESLSKTFQGLKAVNDAYNAVSKGMTAFAEAGTTMGAIGGIAAASTGVIGAVIVLQGLLSDHDSGPSADQMILDSLNELRTMVVDVSKQIEAGFTSVTTQNQRLQNLLGSYSNLNSKNDFILQQEVVSLKENIEKGLQPLKATHLSFTDKLYDQYKSLNEKATVVALYLPNDPATKIPENASEELTNLFAELFTINSSVKKGEYKIAIDSENAVAAHYEIINELANYPPSAFRTAFLTQNAINASNNAACADVNLIGLLMISEASTQVNGLLDKISHRQLAEYFKTPNFNVLEFKTRMKENSDYIDRQRNLVKNCISQAFFKDFEKTQLTELINLVEGQREAFLGDGQRMNDMFVALTAEFPMPGGYQKDKVVAGYLIQQNKSFDPKIWEANAPPPNIQPIRDLGTQSTQITREDYTTLIRDYEIRLANLIGADVEIIAEALPGDEKNKFLSLNLYVASPRSQQIIFAWVGYIHDSFNLSLPVVDYQGAEWSEILAPDSLPIINDALTKSKLGFVRVIQMLTHFKAVGDPLTNTQWCPTIDGFYTCMSSVGEEPFDQWPFEPQYFFTKPAYGIDRNGFDSINRRVEINWQRNNTYRKSFHDGIKKYVEFVNATVAPAFSACALNLVQGNSNSCDMGGLSNIYPDRSNEFRTVENFNLLRLTIDPASQDIQRILELTDVGQIEKMEVEESLDKTLRQTDLYVNKLKDRLKVLNSETSNEALEVPADLSGLLENDSDWLNHRLAPYLDAK